MILKDQMFDCLLLTLKVVSDYKTLSPDSGWANIAKRFQCAYVHALKPKEAMQMIQLHLYIYCLLLTLRVIRGDIHSQAGMSKTFSPRLSTR